MTEFNSHPRELPRNRELPRDRELPRNLEEEVTSKINSKHRTAVTENKSQHRWEDS